ncbi:MAG: ParB/RepB/Spo0J family partition protein [Candidatus Competibacteraceae bacterium]|jgi:ParB family chromosome partitioning protein|nr:ParB/RepB/Spo0J family partition protein [Candidatus Competibacteraceae bacterium]
MAKRTRDTLDFLGVLAGETAQPLTDLPRDRLVELPLTTITPSIHQARKKIDPGELAELAETIREHGVLQPILVRPLESGYELVAGERRWRAAQLAGISSVPAVVREVEDEQAAILGLVENLQRSNLNPIEEAEGYQTLISQGLAQKDIGTAVGKSISAVSRSLGLLELAEPIVDALREGQLEYAHGRALLSLSKKEQIRLGQLAIRRAWSSRQLEIAARKYKEQGSDTQRGRRLKVEDPDIAKLCGRISRHLGARVEFRSKKAGGGQFVVHYNSVDECNGILEKLNLVDLADD